MNFPEYFSASCPPDDASPCAGVVYRFVSQPPRSHDLQPHAERFPGRDWGDSACIACGLSIYTDPDDVAKAQEVVPGMNKKRAAVAELTPAAGLMKNTPSERHGLDSHHTWWVAADVDARSFFPELD